MIASALSRPSKKTFVPFTQCAWCGGVSVAGHYVRIPGLGKSTRQLTGTIPLAGEFQISMSHGICPACADRVFAAARNA